jgi:hypothetical protein
MSGHGCGGELAQTISGPHVKFKMFSTIRKDLGLMECLMQTNAYDSEGWGK